jgi:hypothetical protein
MTKALGYFLVFMLLCGACAEALAGPVDVTDTTVPNAVLSTTSIAGDTTIPVNTSDTAPSSTVRPNNSGATSGGDDIDCDEAEELYDAGNNDDLADYCDYGPDGEWDTEDDYDSWEE